MIHLVFCRTLNSQSAASVTMANYAALLRERHVPVQMTLIDKRKPFGEQLAQLSGGDCLLCKVNADDYRRFFPQLREMKARGRWSWIMLCGPFAALNSTQIMASEAWVDGIILGYGEQAVIDQCLQLKEKRKINPQIEGAWRLDDGNYVVNMPASIFPLTQIPNPARDIETIEPSAIANLEFSRGCENRCGYCHMRAYHDLYGVRRTRKTVNQVMQDIEVLYSLGKRYFIFNDSIFWHGEEDTASVVELCDRIMTSGMKLFFMVYLSLYHFPDEALLRKLSSAGLIRVFVGVENPNSSVLERIKETKYPVRLFETCRQLMDRIQISYHIGYIVFYPFSDMIQVRESIRYLHEIHKMHRVGILLERIRLIPGTPICQYLDREHFDDSELDKAYHYIIRDPLCEKLQAQLMDIFEHTLQGSYIQMELLCCNLDLLVAIVARIEGDMERIQGLVASHRALVLECGELVYSFVCRAMDAVCSGQDVHLDCAFAKHYARIGKALTDSWMALHRALASTVDGINVEVFPFCQEWMEKGGAKWNELLETTSRL